MIRATAGAELCATHENPGARPTDCVHAIDHTHKGYDDLSDRVVVGDPVRKSPLHWVVPYDVRDDAGNEAATVYRDVVVEDVSLAGMEKKIREEVVRQEQRKVEHAIEKAVGAERKKWEAEQKQASSSARGSGNRRNHRGRNNNEQACPVCPPCGECPGTDPVNASTCASHCGNLSATCRRLGEDNYVYTLLLLLEDFFPPTLVPLLVLSFLVVGLVYVVKWMLTILFSPRSYTNYDYGNYNSINDDMVLATGTAGGTTTTAAAAAQESSRQMVPTEARKGNGSMPPTASLSVTSQARNNGTDGSFFSPGSQMGSNYQDRSNRYDTPNNNGTIDRLRSPHTPASIRNSNNNGYEGSSSAAYQSPPLILPSKNGEGARRRSPYR